MKIGSLEEASQALRAYMPSNSSTNWDFALEQMKELMKALGNPQEQVKAIHVAGTSGKTSTCYYIADMLHRAGKTVGLTISPHVDSLNERVQLNGAPVSEEEFCDLLSEFLDLPTLKKYQPSYFGVMVAFAYWVFAQKQLDYMVIEVGLGGRMDATNVIDRADKVAVITDIGLDHVEMLGDNLVSIAGEKAEIIKPHNRAFAITQAEEVLDVFRNKAKSVDAELTTVDDFTNLPSDLPAFQKRNWAVARAVMGYLTQRDKLDLSETTLLASAQLVIPARMETIEQDGKLIIMDGAHNAQKVTALCDSLREKYPQKSAALVSFAEGKDTSMDESMRALSTVVDCMIVTTFEVEQDVYKKSLDPQLVATAAKRAGIEVVTVIPDPLAAYQLLQVTPRPQLLITGSLYLLNAVRPAIRGQHD